MTWRDLNCEGNTVTYIGFVNGFSQDTLLKLHTHNPEGAAELMAAFDRLVTGVEVISREEKRNDVEAQPRAAPEAHDPGAG